MSGNGAIFRFCRATGDHHILADVCPCLGLCPASKYAQCPPGAQAVHQFALESTTTLNVEGLVDGFVRNTHGFVIREVDAQPVGNLFGRPAIDPFSVTSMRFVATLERCLPRAGNLTATSIMNHAFQAVLDVVVQSRVSHQFRRLRPSGDQFCLPLRNRCPILKLACTSCSVACQLS